MEPLNITPIYLDYQASTPIDPTVLEEVSRISKLNYGNPSALHEMGRSAKSVLDKSRKTIANYLGVFPHEVVFTGSATESNSIALWNWYWKCQKSHLITTTIEHVSVSANIRAMEASNNFRKEISWVRPDHFGTILPNDIFSQINDQTGMISVHHAHPVIGTLQPVNEIARMIRKTDTSILFHVDASQSLLTEELKPKDWGVDLMTLSSHKVYGPKGVGVLYMSERAREKYSKGDHPYGSIMGGGQEWGYRSGTPNIPAIAGFAQAIDLVRLKRESDRSRFWELRDALLSKLENSGFQEIGEKEKRIPQNIFGLFEDVNAEDLLRALPDFALSSRSACQSREEKSHPITEELGLDHHAAHSSIRISIGRPTTRNDLDLFASRVLEEIPKLRRL